MPVWIIDEQLGGPIGTLLWWGNKGNLKCGNPLCGGVTIINEEGKVMRPTQRC